MKIQIPITAGKSKKIVPKINRGGALAVTTGLSHSVTGFAQNYVVVIDEDKSSKQEQ